MKKLTLSLDHLRVESFHTDGARGPGGTVRAHDSTREFTHDPETTEYTNNPTLITGCLTCPVHCTADGTCAQQQCGSN
jgi:hypothetical protein